MVICIVFGTNVHIYIGGFVYLYHDHNQMTRFNDLTFGMKTYKTSSDIGYVKLTLEIIEGYQRQHNAISSKMESTKTLLISQILGWVRSNSTSIRSLGVEIVCSF